jgi:hypothetical protein
MRWNYTPLKTLRRLVERHGVTVRETADGRYLVRKFQPFTERETGASWLRLRMTIGTRSHDYADRHAGGWVREFQIHPRWLTADRLPTIQAMTLGLKRGFDPTNCRGATARVLRRFVAEPAWLTATVVSLARSIVADRVFDRVPMLGDALEEAGCESRFLLDHCRKPGDHVEGCWVVDWVVAKLQRSQ